MYKLKTFYRVEQSCKINDCESPSSDKPEKLMTELNKCRLPIEVISFEKCSQQDFKLVHDESYVDDLFAGKIDNGFGNKNLQVIESILWTTGSIVAASIYAYKFKDNTFSPTSGFHHASYAKADGFCTINGLMLSVIKLLNLGAKKIGILDLDYHYGNGLDDIIKHLNIYDN